MVYHFKTGFNILEINLNTPILSSINYLYLCLSQIRFLNLITTIYYNKSFTYLQNKFYIKVVS